MAKGTSPLTLTSIIASTLVLSYVYAEVARALDRVQVLERRLEKLEAIPTPNQAVMLSRTMTLFQLRRAHVDVMTASLASLQVGRASSGARLPPPVIPDRGVC